MRAWGASIDIRNAEHIRRAPQETCVFFCFSGQISGRDLNWISCPCYYDLIALTVAVLHINEKGDKQATERHCDRDFNSH